MMPLGTLSPGDCMQKPRNVSSISRSFHLSAIGVVSGKGTTEVPGLQKLNFYCRFIWGFSSVVAPLTDLKVKVALEEC